MYGEGDRKLSYEQRKQASLGEDRTLYCPTCMEEQEVYSASGHEPNQMNLHCVVCAHFVTRMIKDEKGKWDLDYGVYT